MLRPRIIPVLLVHEKGLVKTVKFKEPKYVGDPLNAVKIFNEKEVDEIIVLDIDASTEGRGPNQKPFRPRCGPRGIPWRMTHRCGQYACPGHRRRRPL